MFFNTNLFFLDWLIWVIRTQVIIALKELYESSSNSYLKR